MLNILNDKKFNNDKNITVVIRSLSLYLNKRALFLSRLSKLILSYNCTSDIRIFNIKQIREQLFWLRLPSTVTTIKFLLKKITVVDKLIKLYEKREKILLLRFPSFFKSVKHPKLLTEKVFEDFEKPIIEYGEFMLFLKKRKNNFYINLHLYNGKLLYTNSVGKVHFKGPKRSTMYGLEELAKKTSTFLAENKINYIRIFITSKVNKRINRVIKLLKSNYPKLRYIVNKVIKYQHSSGLKLKKLRRV